MKINDLLEKASTSSFSLWLLNFVLLRNIPFNKPHRLKIKSISKNKVLIHYPYIKNNLNHLKMVKVKAYHLRKNAEGQPYVSLELLGEVELVQSQNTGRFYATTISLPR